MFRFLLVSLSMLLGLVTSSYAIPAFARQVGVSCSACHSANGYPALTRFGRAFKAGGYTMVGSEKTIGGGKSMEDKLISLPSTLNMSVVGASTIDGTSGQGNAGTTVATNNFGVFLGGRISENIGTFVEIGYDDGTQSFALANFVVPVTFKVGGNIVGIEPFTTDGHTATASELFDNGGNTAFSRIGARDQYGAKGLSFYIFNPNYFVNYTAWSNGNNSDSNIKLANYFRFAYTPQVGPWDIEVGVQYMTGATNRDPSTGAHDRKTDAYSIDFNVLGSLGKYPLDLAISYASAKNDPNSLFTTNSDGKAGKSFVFDTKLGVIPKTLVVHAKYAYDDHVADSNEKISTETLGLKYFITENANVEFNYDFVGKGNPDTYGLAFEVAF